MPENERVKELQAQLDKTFNEKCELKEKYDKLYADYVTTKGVLQDEKRLNERYLTIIENLTEGK